jgi:ribosome biogenesis protein BMS1
LSDKERLIHAPLSDVGGMLFDKDAVYIDLPDWKVSKHRTGSTTTA